MITEITGSVWKCGDMVTVYDIIPQKYWEMSRPEPDAEKLGQHVFEGMTSVGTNAMQFERGKFDIIVAGRNFGCGGKSILHPIIAMQSAGVKLIIAETVSRYCYRNLINLALPVLLCPGISEFAESGETLKADVTRGLIIRGDGAKLICPPIPEFALDVIKKGGELAFYCE